MGPFQDLEHTDVKKKTIKIVKHIQRKLPINGDGSGKKLKNQKKKKRKLFLL